MVEIINRIFEVKNVSNFTGFGTLALGIHYIFKFLTPFFTPILTKTGEAVGDILSDKIKGKKK